MQSLCRQSEGFPTSRRQGRGLLFLDLVPFVMSYQGDKYILYAFFAIWQSEKNLSNSVGDGEVLLLHPL
jgi:hypothetical protein